MAYGLTQSADLESSSSQYFSRADTASLSLTGDFTLEGWVKFESLPADGSAMRFVQKWTGGGTDDRAYQFYFRNNGGTYELVCITSSTGAGAVVDVVAVAWTPSTGTWYHVAVTADLAATSTYKFYVNGTQQGADQNGTVPSMSDTAAPFLLGVNGNLVDSFFDGRMSLWRVWSAVLSQATIAANICNVYGGATANMAAEWSLDNVLTDASGNGNTLTNNNSIVFGVDTPATCASAGPSNLKSLDGNLKANIKSYNTNVLANIKSISGNS